MEILPQEIILLHIFPLLNRVDIFNIGECCQRLRGIVTENILHPLSTELQYLKTRKKFFMQEESAYDDIESFRNIQKCLKTTCKCQNFIQRKNIVMLNPSVCTTCTFYHGFPSYCMYHYILMNKLFEYELCTDCLENNKICFICNKELDNICGWIWTFEHHLFNY